MKKLIFLLCLSLPLLGHSQCDTLNLDDRKVISHAAHLWEHNYEHIIDDHLIGNHLGIDSMILIDTTFNRHFDRNYIANTIHFWYYLDDENTPRIAIQTGADSFIIYANDGSWVPANMDGLSDSFTNWHNFTANDGKPFIYVEQYQFDKSYIDNLFKDAKRIIIKNVVHTVSPDSRRYDLPDTYKGEDAELFEGFLAFDILLIALDENGNRKELNHYNFAKPCPKICNTPIFTR